MRPQSSLDLLIGRGLRLLLLAVALLVLTRRAFGFKKVTGRDKVMPLSWEPRVYGVGDNNREMYKVGEDPPDEGLSDEERDPSWMAMFSVGDEPFVQQYGDPTVFRGYKNTPGGANRLNETQMMGTGEALTNWVQRFENVGVSPRQLCPGMTPEPEGGHIGDMYDTKPGSYYCVDKHHGYCDRRTGTCWCYTGYTGMDCSRCRHTHFESSKIAVGVFGGSELEASVCSPKIRCPNDCSGGGDCDYATGKCACHEHRAGEDCSLHRCSLFHPFCESCNENTCIECVQRYFVDDSGSCSSCAERHDPRCLHCNKDECLECVDPLLSSTSRSGRRPEDPELPFDELERELAHGLPFGTQDPRFFDEAESFHVVYGDQELRDASVSCSQGSNGTNDAAWHCVPEAQSHRVCGHTGTVAFSSPTYAVLENARNVSLTVKRSGGGVGTCAVSYSIQYGTERGIWYSAVDPLAQVTHTSTPSDASPTAFYTTSQTLRFHPGVVSLTFMVTIHDDNELEADEKVWFRLSDPDNCKLGPQSTAELTILDDDYWQTSSIHSIAFGDGLRQGVAGTPMEFTIQSRTPTGRNQTSGGDTYVVEMWDASESAHAVENRHFDAYGEMHSYPYHHGDPQTSAEKLIYLSYPDTYAEEEDEDGNLETVSRALRELDAHSLGGVRTPGTCANTGDGAYNCSIVASRAAFADRSDHDAFAISVELAYPYGLLGEYWDNVFFDKSPQVRRVDAVVNFTWGTGSLTMFASDFVSVRWSGAIKTPDSVSEGIKATFAFRVLADDNVRLWIDGNLLVDSWDTPSGHLNAANHSLVGGRLARILLEYRELRGSAHAKLYWTPPGGDEEIIPSRWLYQLRHIHGSPFQNVVVRDAITDAGKCTAFGRALSQSRAGDVARFTIQPRDRFGNKRRFEQKPTDVFLVAATYLGDENTTEGPKVIEATLKYRKALRGEEAEYAAAFEPILSGNYSLAVQLLDAESNTFQDIYGSPFTLRVTPGRIFPSKCDASGPGLVGGVVGEKAIFDIVARDVYGNLQPSPKKLFDVRPYHLEHSHGAALDTIEHVGGPHFRVYYDVTKAGQVSLHVSHGCNEPQMTSESHCEHFEASPYTVTFLHASVRGGTSVGIGVGLQASVSGVEAEFVVEPFDMFGNPVLNLSRSGLADPSEGFSMRIYSGNVTMGASGQCNAVEPQGAKSYFRCTYTPTNATVQDIGTWKLAVFAINEGETPAEAEAANQILGSPFNLTISDGACKGSASAVYGSGLEANVAGKEASFIVQARDAAHNNRTVDGDAFTVMLRDPNGDTIFGNASKYLGNGMYRATYTATVAGEHELTITLDADGEMTESRVHRPVTLPAEISANESHAYGSGIYGGVAGEVAPVIIQAVDAFGNNRSFEDDDVFVDLYSSSSGTRLLSVTPIPGIAGTGMHDASFVPTSAEDCALEVYVAQSGGLRAEYFNTASLVSVNTLGRADAGLNMLDSLLEFDWTDYSSKPPTGKPPHKGFPAEAWSARWRGRLKVLESIAEKPDAAIFLQLHVRVEGGVRMWLDGERVIDGWPAASSSEYIVTPSWSTTPGSLHHIRIEYAKTKRASASLSLKWRAFGMKLRRPEDEIFPLSTIPPEALCQILPIANAPLPLQIAPAATHPATSLAHGSALYSAKSGVESSFLVQARDRFGNNRSGCDDEIIAIAWHREVHLQANTSKDGTYELLGAPGEIVGEVTETCVDGIQGLYRVSYTPTLSGNFLLHVALNEKGSHPDLGLYAFRASINHAHVKSSPFLLQVDD